MALLSHAGSMEAPRATLAWQARSAFSFLPMALTLAPRHRSARAVPADRDSRTTASAVRRTSAFMTFSFVASLAARGGCRRTGQDRRPARVRRWLARESRRQVRDGGGSTTEGQGAVVAGGVLVVVHDDSLAAVLLDEGVHGRDGED